ncbi:chloride channel protein [Sessilibacter sp. MAH4]
MQKGFRSAITSSLTNFRHQLSYLNALPQLTILGLITGCLAAVLIVSFRALIELGTSLYLPNSEGFETLPFYLRFLVPFAGAVIIGIIFQFLPKRSIRVGAGYVLDRLYNFQGHLAKSNFWVQFFAGALCLITGQSVGREGPAVHLGAGAASGFGKVLKIPNNSLRNLVACGVAAAISASFNTPLAGVIFAMEVVLMEYTITGFVPVIMASFAGALITRLAFGTEFVFSVQDIAITSLTELPFLLVAGVLIGLLATVFSKLMLLKNPLHATPIFIRISFAGAVTGVIALYLPEILGLGYDTVAEAMLDHTEVKLLTLILIGKIIATGVSVNLGMPGGLIGPTLFIGAIFGAILSFFAHWAYPIHASGTTFYVLVSMTASLGAVLNAPLTALVTMLELTNNPTIIFPSMLVVVISCLTTRYFIGDQGIFVTSLKSQGLIVKSTSFENDLRRIGIRSLMNVKLVSSPYKIDHKKAIELLEKRPDWIVLNELGKTKRLLRAADLARFLEDAPNAILTLEKPIDLLEVPGKKLTMPPIHEQATVLEAHLLMKSESVEAVYVQNPRQLPLETEILGVVTRDDINNYYSV